jgi:hypothetical protein
MIGVNQLTDGTVDIITYGGESSPNFQKILGGQFNISKFLSVPFLTQDVIGMNLRPGTGTEFSEEFSFHPQNFFFFFSDKTVKIGNKDVSTLRSFFQPIAVRVPSGTVINFDANALQAADGNFITFSTLSNETLWVEFLYQVQGLDLLTINQQLKGYLQDPKTLGNFGFFWNVSLNYLADTTFSFFVENSKGLLDPIGNLGPIGLQGNFSDLNIPVNFPLGDYIAAGTQVVTIVMTSAAGYKGGQPLFLRNFAHYEESKIPKKIPTREESPLALSFITVYKFASSLLQTNSKQTNKHQSRDLFAADPVVTQTVQIDSISVTICQGEGCIPPPQVQAKPTGFGSEVWHLPVVIAAAALIVLITVIAIVIVSMRYKRENDRKSKIMLKKTLELEELEVGEQGHVDANILTGKKVRQGRFGEVKIFFFFFFFF